MGLREQLIVMKYSLKNTVINPTIKYRSGLIVLAFTAFSFALFLAILVTHTSGGTGPSVNHDLRVFLATYGLNRFVVTDILSSALTAITLLAFALTPPNVPVREAEYELILAQPVSIEDFLMGKALAGLAQQFVFPMYILSMLIIASFLAPSPEKALVGTASLLTALTYLTVLDLTTNVVSLATSKHGFRGWLRAACLAYLIAGLTHSALLKRPSPLLAVPLKPLAASITYSFAVTPGAGEALAWLALSAVIVAAVFSLIPLLSGVVGVEDLKPLTPPSTVKGGGGASRGRVLVSLNLGSPGKAVASVIYFSTFLSTNHLTGLLAVLTLPTLACLGVKYFLPSWVAGLTGFTINFLVPLLTAMMLTALLNSVLANDLMTYWIYRVYLTRMEPVASALLLKVLTYTMEAVAVMATSITALTLKPLNLLLIPLTLPAAVLASFASLALVTYFASKRKVVKQAPSGMYVIESTPVFLIEFFFITALLSASAVTQVLAGIGAASTLLIAAATSLTIGAVLTPPLTKALAKLMERYDILT